MLTVTIYTLVGGAVRVSCGGKEFYCLPLQICQYKGSFISTTVGLVETTLCCVRVSNNMYSHFLKCCTMFSMYKCFHYNFVCYLCVQSSCRTYTTYILVFKGQLIGGQSFMDGTLWMGWWVRLCTLWVGGWDCGPCEWVGGTVHLVSGWVGLCTLWMSGWVGLCTLWVGGWDCAPCEWVGLASFPGLPRLRFLIACSMRKLAQYIGGLRSLGACALSLGVMAWCSLFTHTPCWHWTTYYTAWRCATMGVRILNYTRLFFLV